MICLQTVSVVKEYNVKQLYETQHKTTHDQFEGSSREALYEDLKRKYKKQLCIMSSFTKSLPKNQKAAYEVVVTAGKAGVTFRKVEVIKECAIKMALAFGADMLAKQFESVSLSHQSVSRKIVDVNQYLTEKTKEMVEKCIYFSLALDESTDVTDTNQLLIFIWMVNNEFIIYEELLRSISLDGSKGTDIFNTLCSVVEEYGDLVNARPLLPMARRR